MADLDSMSKKLNAWFDNPDNVEHARQYFKRIEEKEAMQDNQVDRFWQKYKDDFDTVVNKITTRYESDAYVRSWYKRGIEPPTPLYFFLRKVVMKYGREYTQEEYENMENNMFTSDVYVLGDWIIELIVGQGSAILIRRKDGK